MELQDIADELERIDDNVKYSAERIQLVSDRISIGYKLMKKHSVNTTSALLTIQDELKEKLNNIQHISDEIGEKEKLACELFQHSKQMADLISVNRKKAIPSFTEKVNSLLTGVGMPNARFKVDLQALENITINGGDKIGFMFDANLPADQVDEKSHFEPIGKVASGGELSRLMLCIKSLAAKQLQLPTLIFDEIDTGISGEAAKQVGNIMKDLSLSHQLIAITHQPQIAAKATAHYFVYKSIKEDKIVTAVRLLNNDERITTIAQMLSGEKPTAAALQNAREMVGN